MDDLPVCQCTLLYTSARNSCPGTIVLLFCCLLFYCFAASRIILNPIVITMNIIDSNSEHNRISHRLQSAVKNI